MTTNLFVIANVKQLRTGGSFRILLPFFRTSWGVGDLNSAIFNSFSQLGWVWHDFGGPPPPSVRHCLSLHINNYTFLEQTHCCHARNSLILQLTICIFISVFNQLDVQNLFHNKFYFMPLHVTSTCAHHQEVKIALHSLWYHHTYRWPSRARVERGICSLL